MASLCPAIKLNFASPGNNDFPLTLGKADYMVLLSGAYTVPAGKTLFLTAAGQSIKLQIGTSTFDHAISPAMPMIPGGYSISDCNCTAFLTSLSNDVTPIILNYYDPNLANGYTVPAGKVLVIKSGLPTDFGRLEVSLDNGANWTILVVALSPNEAASRAPSFPAGTRVRIPFGMKLTLTGYLFAN